MLSVNKKEVELTSFPDNTLAFRYDAKEQRGNFLIEWRYDDERECMALWYLVNHIRESQPTAKIMLDMPYLPNARMDRVKNTDEVFTLKWFARFINGMWFDSVRIRDPHSNVGVALINRAQALGIADIVREVTSKIPDASDLIYCFPDEGATKKYSEQIKGEYVFGIKHRDWRTGAISELQLNEGHKVNGKNVLIVDDICSRGGTFIFMAKALKDAEAKQVYLYVTHCENTIFEGEILGTDLISRVFTTSSIFRGKHEKIIVI